MKAHRCTSAYNWPRYMEKTLSNIAKHFFRIVALLKECLLVAIIYSSANKVFLYNDLFVNYWVCPMGVFIIYILLAIRFILIKKAIKVSMIILFASLIHLNILCGQKILK